MNYDFTSIMDRRGHDALAVDAIGNLRGFAPEAPSEGFDVIPMWVADMNFPAFPGITQAIADRIQHPAFGYFQPRQEYYDAIIRWQQVRHGIQNLTPDCIGYENGVLGGLVSALNVFCSRGDNVLVHSPTYIGFTNTLKNNGYHIIHSPLVYEAGTWRMDYEDMERKIRDHHIHAAILCSPHNPCGRVWIREELERAYTIFEKYDVKVISDEIWSDIILGTGRGNLPETEPCFDAEPLPGAESCPDTGACPSRIPVHIPSQSVSVYARDNTVALYAPSKTFNLAGLVGSYHIIYDPTLRDRVRKESSLSHYNEMNVLSMHALIGAYTDEGMQWVDQLCRTLTGNVRYAADYIRTRFEGVTLAEPEGTYMLFPDCTAWCRSRGKSLQELEHLCWQAGVALQDGKMFGGPCHLRINLALPFSRVQEAMERLDRYVFNAGD